MPVSSSSNKKPVIDLLKKFNCKNIFELGVGYGQFGKLIKKEIKESKIFGIEIFTKYFSKIPKECYEYLYNENMRFFDYKKYCEMKFDAVLAIDVIEHVERDQGILLINKLIDFFPIIIISVPIVDNEQGAFQGNEYEIHRTQWKIDQLQKMGFILVFNDELIGVFYKINPILQKLSIDQEMACVSEVKNGCLNIGDELIMSGICKILKQNKHYVKLYLKRHPELFKNNSNVDEIIFEPWKQETMQEVRKNGMLDVLNLNEYIKTFGIDVGKEKILPEMYLTDDEVKWGIEEIKKIKDERFLVCFVPHSVNSPASLSQGWNSIVYDKDLLNEVQFVYFGQDKYENMINFNKFNIRQIASLIKCCNLYMGINTGLYHIAKCFKIKGFIVNRKICREHWGYDDDFHFENFSSSEIFLKEFKKEYKKYITRTNS